MFLKWLFVKLSFFNIRSCDRSWSEAKAWGEVKTIWNSAAGVSHLVTGTEDSRETPPWQADTQIVVQALLLDRTDWSFMPGAFFSAKTADVFKTFC